MMALTRAYEAVDASLAEINPFILARDGKVARWTPRSISTTTLCTGTRT